MHGGKVSAVNMIATDITERKKAEERYRDLIEKEKDIIYTLDGKGNITFASPAVETISGYRPKELIGKHFMVLIPKELQQRTLADFNNLLKIGEITAETVLLDKKGQPHFVEYSSMVIKEVDKVVGTRGIVRDITERKRMEKKLQESEKQYRTLIENQGEGIGIVDVEERFTFANPAAHEIFGVPQGELVGRNLHEFVDAKTFAFIQSQTEVRRAGKKSTYEIKFNRLGGERRHLLVTATPRFDDKRQFIGTFGIFLDITARKRMEEELKRSMRLLEISERNLKQFSRKILSVREEEKRILATNLHDEVGAMAVALTSGLDIIEHEIKNNNLQAAFESLYQIKNTVKRQIKILKDIALDVHPPDLDIIGLPDVLRTYFSNINKKAKIKIDFSVDIGEKKINDSVAITLYRIAQEALSNTLTHANAKEVKARLYFQKGNIKLDICDDGKGFDIKKTLNQPKMQGIGIRGMLERTESLDGRFVIKSAPGKGTEIRVSIPNK